MGLHAYHLSQGLSSCQYRTTRKISQVPVLGLRLLCSKICLLCFLVLLQFSTYYARFYATLQAIMLPITYIHFI